MGATVQQSGTALPALTSIRFFAALAVVLSHFTALGLLSTPVRWIQFIDGGRPAVSLFFVLSGFILTLTYRDALGNGGIKRFYVARFARIYPALALSAALAMPVTIYLLSTDDGSLMHQWYALKHKDYLALGVSLFCQLLLLTARFPCASINQPWNGPTWSLSCEALFYSLFPLLLSKIARCRIRTILIGCIGLWMCQGIWILVAEHVLPVGRRGFM